MPISALAVDFDGTLACAGVVAPTTYQALDALRSSGRRLILISGRSLEDLATVAHPLERYDFIVAENGGILFEPASNILTAVAQPPPVSFLMELQRIGVPANQCRVMVTTESLYERVVGDIIRSSQLPWQIILNRASAMVLPIGVDKASGLRCALQRLQIAAAETAGIGDAENDSAFLGICGLAAAVQNAVPALTSSVEIITRQSSGLGVVEFIREFILRDYQ